MKTHGVIYLNVSIYLKTDLTEEEINDLVSEVDYSFNHRLISDTRINGYELNE